MILSYTRLPLKENVPLAPLTTLGVGGPARFFVEATHEAHVIEALGLAKAKQWPLFVMGGGSNLLISDRGFPGLVIRIALKGIRFEGTESSVVTAAAGEVWDEFVSRAVDRNLAGVECLSGIPGTVGGSPIQNVGAYGQDVSETISAVRALDRENQSVIQLEAGACGFSYRSSIFNSERQNRYIVLGVSFQLRADGLACLRYADLQKRFSGDHCPPSLMEVRRAVLEIRISKAMVLQPGNTDSHSAGSFFKNILADEAKVRSIEERARQNGLLGPAEALPRFETSEGMFKLPAAWLIERAGFSRGHGHGRVGLSSKHALAIVNRGGAKAEEVLDFMRVIQDRVKDRFGLDLLPEPVFVGFE